MIIRAFTRILQGWRPDTDASQRYTNKRTARTRPTGLNTYQSHQRHPLKCCHCEAFSYGNSFVPAQCDPRRLPQSQRRPHDEDREHTLSSALTTSISRLAGEGNVMQGSQLTAATELLQHVPAHCHLVTPARKAKREAGMWWSVPVLVLEIS